MLRELRECVVPVDRRWRDDNLKQARERAGCGFDACGDKCLATVGQEHDVFALEVAGDVFDDSEVVACVVVKTVSGHAH
jgi:hypothetical protein